jgi:hypothetical protein
LSRTFAKPEMEQNPWNETRSSTDLEEQWSETYVMGWERKSD